MMQFSSCRLFIVAALILLVSSLAVLGQHTPAVPATVETPGVLSADVLVKMPDAGSQPQFKRMRASAAFHTVTVAATNESTVEKLLLAHKITPDVYSLGLIMDLNPNIKNLNALSEGQEIILPTVNRRAFGQAADAGFEITVASNQAEYKKLGRNIVEIEEQLRRAAEIPTGRFETPAARAEFMESLAANHKLLKETQLVALNRQTLWRVNRLAQSMSSILNTATSAGEVQPALLQALNSNKESLTFVVEQAQAFYNQQPVKVSVTTLKIVGNAKADGLRVRCKYEADYLVDIAKKRDIDTNAINFETKTNPGKQGLDESAYYYLWVVDEATRRRVKEPERKQIVRNSNPCDTGDYCWDFSVDVP